MHKDPIFATPRRADFINGHFLSKSLKSSSYMIKENNFGTQIQASSLKRILYSLTNFMQNPGSKYKFETNLKMKKIRKKYSF